MLNSLLKKNEKGQVAEVGDDGIEDGEKMTVTIFEWDDDGEHDKITTKNATVKDKKIEVEWKVEYTEDTDDKGSDEEMEEKGYTLPEYVFVIELDFPKKVGSTLSTS